MKIHEYQARQILKNFDVPVPVAEVASSPEEARKIAEEIGGKIWAVKSQIHAGGRGKGGGVKLARSLDDVSNLSKLMIGSRLVTKQTGPAGAPVSKVLGSAGPRYRSGVLCRVPHRPKASEAGTHCFC